MYRTNWFDRRFHPIEDNGLLPGIIERLDGTPVRLKSLLADAGAVRGVDSGWSLSKEVGHLIDLEPLWLRRAQEIMDGHANLSVADLANRATHDGDHDQHTLTDLVERFETARSALVSLLRRATDSELEHSAKHPRLGTPMRMIDLAYFVAEHDDHHLVRIRELVESASGA